MGEEVKKYCVSYSEHLAEEWCDTELELPSLVIQEVCIFDIAIRDFVFLNIARSFV